MGGGINNLCLKLGTILGPIAHFGHVGRNFSISSGLLILV